MLACSLQEETLINSKQSSNIKAIQWQQWNKSWERLLLTSWVHCTAATTSSSSSGCMTTRSTGSRCCATRWWRIWIGQILWTRPQMVPEELALWWGQHTRRHLITSTRWKIIVLFYWINSALISLLIISLHARIKRGNKYQTLDMGRYKVAWSTCIRWVGRRWMRSKRGGGLHSSWVGWNRQ